MESKIWHNELIYEIETDIENRFVVAGDWRKAGWICPKQIIKSLETNKGKDLKLEPQGQRTKENLV